MVQVRERGWRRRGEEGGGRVRAACRVRSSISWIAVAKCMN